MRTSAAVAYASLLCRGVQVVHCDTLLRPSSLAALPLEHLIRSDLKHATRQRFRFDETLDVWDRVRTDLDAWLQREDPDVDRSPLQAARNWVCRERDRTLTARRVIAVLYRQGLVRFANGGTGLKHVRVACTQEGLSVSPGHVMQAIRLIGLEPPELPDFTEPMILTNRQLQDCLPAVRP